MVKYICHVKKWCNDKFSEQWLFDTAYTIRGMYTRMIEGGMKVQWSHYIWNRLTVPKHRFILWLAIQGKLKTKDRLHQYGIGTDDLCSICGRETESSIHLFFDCCFSDDCKKAVLTWVGIPGGDLGLFPLLRKAERYTKGDFRRKVMYTVIAGLVYHVWKARNESVWLLKTPTVNQVVKNVQTDVRGRIQNIMGRKVSSRDRDWFSSL
ncbi:uncharacterized protein [Spinacia oleracea]|uniref:Reverse transcriptase zinc-binding domain-containing protein n=1 Tax=Spinacia oleracea TaxID=3562 RepID=A0A9R0IW37_SPIOL|nr:uncharacterized protein LOC110794691 [Spinacia oleracea]